MLTVHVRIADAATGGVTPCRLRVTGPAGEYYSPLGRSADFPTGRGEDVGGGLYVGREKWATVSGSCEMPLPAGVLVRLRAMKGPEFAPLDITLVLGRGQLSLRLTLTRVHDTRADGWHPGDPRVHFSTPDAALLAAAAEDLAVVELLALAYRQTSLDGNNYTTYPQLDGFSGQHPARESAAAVVAVNTLNAHPVLGRIALLHAHRVVHPLNFGEPDAADDWSVSDWCDQCHRKGGLTVWASPFEIAHGGEALVALVNGKVDAIEADGRSRRVPLLPAWYQLLNAGFRVPLLGASGADSNRTPVGAVRTYASIEAGKPFALGAWVEAVRAGACFATTRPLLTFTAEGHGPGSTLAAGRVVPVRATAWSLAPFGRLDLVADGVAVAGSPGVEQDGVWTAEVERDLTPTAGGWLAARVNGPPGPLAPDLATFAHTSPIYLDGPPPAGRSVARAKLARKLAESREWVESVGRFEDAKSRGRLLAAWAAAAAVLGDT